MTDFSEKVYSLCKKVPKGRVTTYGEIGKALGGRGQIYRAVGRSLNINPYAPRVPCHRVVASDGGIGGFASGIRKKIKLLRSERIKIKDNKIVDFEKVVFKFRKG